MLHEKALEMRHPVYCRKTKVTGKPDRTYIIRKQTVQAIRNCQQGYTIKPAPALISIRVSRSDRL